jgi:predicted DsbA family dithiol-disulfide isomerase
MTLSYFSSYNDPFIHRVVCSGENYKINKNVTRKEQKHMDELDPFHGLAQAYDLAGDTQKHVRDVMERYRDKIELGEKITEPDFMEDIALAAGLGPQKVREMLTELRQSLAWRDTVDELHRIWEAQERESNL